MAAYASLVTLVNVLNRTLHPCCPVALDKPQIQSLCDKVSFLVDFVEEYSKAISKDFERKMSNVAFAVEDMVESYIVDRIRATSMGDRDTGYTLFHGVLEKEILKVDDVIREAMEVKENKSGADVLCRSYVRARSTMPPSDEIKMVGFDDELVRLMDQLTMGESSRQIIPVVGMGGIGKTTLAKNVYDHPYVTSHFQLHAWATISQEYNLGEIICVLLCEKYSSQTSNEKLGEQLHKHLYGRKYLIILDDVWSSVVWDEIRRFFPDNNNGSKILLTTRLLNVADYIGSCCPYEVKFLDGDKSWDLLSAKVFGQEVCPPELEKCGKKIAKSCKGLPLAIVVIGGVLKMSKMVLEYWENIAENMSSIICTENDEHCLKILSLSYHHLPVHLKPCLLYMVTFPEDYEIRVSRLVLLWVSDGFLKPSAYKSLEEVALEYLNDLIHRNLIIIKKRNSRGQMTHLTVHDLVRDLCVREAKQERFSYIIKGEALDHPEPIEIHRRFTVHGSGPKVLPMPQMAHARSLTLFGKKKMHSLSGLRLARVFVSCELYAFENITQLVNSRALEFSAVPNEQSAGLSLISALWNLETLIVHCAPAGYTLLCEIWELRHLRHIFFHREVLLPESPITQTSAVLNNLQTLKRIENFCFSDEVLKRIPNIRKLEIFYNPKHNEKLSPCFQNMVHCQKLEKLKLLFRSPNIFSMMNPAKVLSDDLSTLKFSPNLRKLCLMYSYIPWGNMTIVGSLPSLEFLELRIRAFSGDEWHSNEGEFQNLKVLLFESCDLKKWEVDEVSYFPRLTHLSFQNMKYFEEIPQVFEESMTLVSIAIHCCLKSVIMSAKQILEEQQSQGNDDLSVQVSHILGKNDKDDKEELESLAGDNFRIKVV